MIIKWWTLEIDNRMDSIVENTIEKHLEMYSKTQIVFGIRV